MIRSYARKAARSVAPLALVLALGFGVPEAVLAATEAFEIDTVHSSVGFSVRHLTSKAKGRFTKFGGTIQLDRADFNKTAVQVEIDPATINTDVEKRDNHLRSEDFFDVAKHPKMAFVSTAVKMKDQTTGTMTGNLTMRGVTKPVTLDVEVGGFQPGPKGTSVAGFSATGKVSRKDFGILWNRNLDHGGVILGEDVTIAIEVEARTKVPETEATGAAPAAAKPGGSNK